LTNNEIERKKKNHIEYAKILKVSNFSTANRILKRSILLSAAGHIGMNKCFKCKEPLTVDDFTIAHIKPWRRCYDRDGDANLFWDIDNIALEHAKCNCVDAEHWSKRVLIKHWPTEHECNKNVKDETLKLQLNFDHDLLGMEFGKANHRLFRQVMFKWCEKVGFNFCNKCTKPIRDIEDWTIEHIVPWRLGPTDDDKRHRFYSLENIGFSHLHCNCGGAQLGKGKTGYNGVKHYIDNRTGYETYQPSLVVKGKLIYLPTSTNLVEAAENYDMGLIKYRNGEGILNFPEKENEYIKKIADGWDEPLKCKICGGKHFGKGYCRKHHYHLAGGKEYRRQQYLKNERTSTKDIV
jgi:hypothetical protein